MKTVERALKAGLCALAVGGMLLASSPAASAASWHWVARFDLWAACQTRMITHYGGWNADHVKCEIDGTWHPTQTYSLYLYY